VKILERPESAIIQLRAMVCFEDPAKKARNPREDARMMA